MLLFRVDSELICVVYEVCSCELNPVYLEVFSRIGLCCYIIDVLIYVLHYVCVISSSMDEAKNFVLCLIVYR